MSRKERDIQRLTFKQTIKTRAYLFCNNYYARAKNDYMPRSFRELMTMMIIVRGVRFENRFDNEKRKRMVLHPTTRGNEKTKHKTHML